MDLDVSASQGAAFWRIAARERSTCEARRRRRDAASAEVDLEDVGVGPGVGVVLNVDDHGMVVRRTRCADGITVADERRLAAGPVGGLGVRDHPFHQDHWSIDLPARRIAVPVVVDAAYRLAPTNEARRSPGVHAKRSHGVGVERRGQNSTAAGDLRDGVPT